MCSNPCESELTCFRPESNRGPYGLLNFWSAALTTTELWWRMNHRKSFRTLSSQAQSGIHPQSYWSPCAFAGMHLQSHWAPCAFTGMYPHTNPQSRCPSQPFAPTPASMIFNQISYKRQHGSAWQHMCSPGFNPLEFLSLCGLSGPVLSCLATSDVSSLGGARKVFPHPGSLWLWEAWKRHSYRPPPRDLGVRGASIVRIWTLVFGWPQLGLITTLRLPF